MKNAVAKLLFTAMLLCAIIVVAILVSKGNDNNMLYFMGGVPAGMLAAILAWVSAPAIDRMFP